MLTLQFCFVRAAKGNTSKPTVTCYRAAQLALANGHGRAAYMAYAARNGFNFFTARTQWQRAKGVAQPGTAAAVA